MNPILKFETNTLFGIIDELNYYQILRLRPSCIQTDIEDAYKQQINHYHPQRFEDSDEELHTKAQYILLSIKEAYAILKDISSRLKYDHLMANGSIRIENTKLLNSQESSVNTDPSQAATNDSSKKYWSLGLQAFEEGDFASAALQIQFALQFEPNNEIFQEWLQKAKEEAEKAPKQNNNPYKLRI